MSAPERQVRYFAVPDPDDHDRMTYWRIDKAGRLNAHPAKARYGPILWKRPGAGHVHVTPAGLTGHTRRLWVHHWYETVQRPWLARVQQAIDADPAAAAQRFGRLVSRCCCCGKELTDPTSKTYGIGPECRRGMTGDVLAYLNEMLGRAHARHLTQTGEAP